MDDQTGAVVLAISAMAMLSAALGIGGRIRAALVPMAVNVAAVAAIFASFAYSVEVGMDVRPWAKAADGIAALVAASAVQRLVAD